MKMFNPRSTLCLSGISKHRRRLRKKGVSPVVSTAILVSVMLIIAVTVMGFASNMFSVESQNVEFDQAKSTMVNFAGIVEQASSKVGSSGYVVLNSRSGGPSFLSNIGNISVTFFFKNTTFTSINYTLISGYYSTLKYRGGSLSGVIGKTYLRGAEGLITSDNNSTLGSVYVEQANGSWVVLDYARIGVLNLGNFTFYNNTLANGTQVFETVNLIQIQYLNLTKGSFSGSGSINTVATCKSINVTYLRINATQVKLGNYNLTITMKLTPVGKPQNISLYQTPLLSMDTIIMVVQSNVEISMFGG